MRHPFRVRSLREGMGLSVGFNVLSKGVGYGRQLLMAYYFGVQRGLDVYFMTFNIVMLLVYSYSTWFDQVGVPHLVQTKEQEGEEAYRELTGSVISFSLVMGAVLALAVWALFPLVGRVLASGLAPVERQEMRGLVPFFLPWVLVIFPYNAAGAVVKSLRYFDILLLGDLLVSVTALAGFFLFHDSLAVLPLSLACGHLLVLALFLVVVARRGRLHGPLRTAPMRALYRKFMKLFGAGATTIAHQAVERFYQSFLLPGAISAWEYAKQTLTPVFDLLGFRDLFVVALSSQEQREEKLHRLLCGVLLLAVPAALFLYVHAGLVVDVLYQRGRFDRHAADTTGRVLSVLALSIIPGALNTVLGRVLQIQDRILHGGLVNLLGAGFILVLNAVLVFWLKLDVIGLAASFTAVTCFNSLLMVHFLRASGLRFDAARLSGYAFYSLAAALAALALLQALPRAGAALWTLALQGPLFLLATALLHLPLRRKVLYILYGEAAR